MTKWDGQYEPGTIESKWQRRWVEEETYGYQEAVDPNTVFSIDTPPPTVSGNLHMGHLYQFTLQDFVARFNRMRGGDVYFPIGYDDNGIASELLTEKELGVHHQDFDRRTFQEKCREVCRTYEENFSKNVQSLAISIDWNNTYKTIEPRVQRISQLSFIDLYEQGREYRQTAPAIWCPECETAISQVETEDSQRDTLFNDIRFELVDHDEREHITVSTTRPELLPACVAVFVHPEDDARSDLVGKRARVPLFGQEVTILADERVEKEKGTGIVMCCTFGDQTDIEWYQAHDLPLRVAIDESGTMTAKAGRYEGMSTHEAREAIVDDLTEDDHLEDQEPIAHVVQVHERCECDIEFRVTDQWYISVLDKAEEYLEIGREMDWYPEKMFTRYEHWIEGLEWDWCISRQRDSGIPFPVWYCGECAEVILAEKESLPVDPLAEDPPIDTCPECGHDTFEPEQDVFDTWATSSLTPLVNANWDWNEETEAFEFDRPELYPMDLRPQGHDIISFWLFNTIIKCYEHTGEVPFDAVMINGMVLDEDREAMSKSKGNVVEPDEVLSEFPVDAARYWAAGTSIGDDFPFSKNDLVTGEKLLQKLWNASKLVADISPETPAEPAGLEPIDEWLLASLDEATMEVTTHFEEYDFSKARDTLRAFFWHTFCDNYLEIAKHRDSASTDYALRVAHQRLLKLFAPYLPHVTEELWRKLYGDTSIHQEEWPEPIGHETDFVAGETAMKVLEALRRYKTENNLALNASLEYVGIYGDIDGFEEAITSTMHVDTFEKLSSPPETKTEISDISLDYATLGPKYGNTIGDIESGIEAGEFEIVDRELHVADETLEAESFEVHEERTYRGDGTLLQEENVVILVQ